MDFTTMSLDDITAYITEQRAAITALFALDAPTGDQVAEAQALAADIRAAEAEVATRNEAAAAQQAEFDALRSEFTEQPEEDPAQDDQPEDDGGEDDDPPADPHDPAQQDPPADPAPTQARARGVQTLARRSTRPATPAQASPGYSLVAAADVPNFAAGSKLEGIEGLAKAALNRMKGFTPPTGDGSREDLHKFGVATIQVDYDPEFTIGRGTDDMEVLYRAANEARLDNGEGGAGSLVAAGGWCAPSETLYDLAADESLDGILSLPEVNIKRGGIRYTQGPQFADFYAEAGFIQTEAQAIAGATKPCYIVDCPTWQEVRLDAVGLCIKVPILTNSAYPELIQRFTSGTLIAHEHMLNANVISRMLALTPAARVFTGLGSTVDDTLEALELVIMQRRQKYRLSFGRTMEVVVPFWVKGAARADLARRNGRDSASVSDSELDAHFKAAGASVSYVYDWQVLDETVEEYPATFNALVYPAGTFVKGVSDVINLSAVYDAASLAENVYTGLFMERGLLVAKMQYDADLVTLPICNAGRRGALDITCAVTP